MYYPALLRKKGFKKWLWLLYSTSFSLLFLIFSSPTHAQMTNNYNSYTQSNIDTSIPQNQHFFIQSTVVEFLAGGICQLIDVDVFHPNQGCLKINPETHQLALSQKSTGGLVGTSISMIAATYQPAASSSEFIAYVRDNFGLTHPAYAQEGPGFQSLSPLIKIWSIFRNISYIFFILVFALIGLAIMLRVKIDPRTVMTIQNQIPKIIVCVVLITFSYAIAGMLIDLMYVTSYVLLNTFANSSVTSTKVANDITKKDGARDSYFSNNPFGFTNNLFPFASLVTDTAGGIKDVVGSLLSGSFQQHEEQLSIAQRIGNFFGSVINTITGALGGILAFFVGFAALFIVAIAILIALFRLWFILIKAYVYTLLDVAIAPLWIAAGLVPGSTVNFSSWFRHLTAHIIVFPTTLGLFLMCDAFKDSFSNFNSADTASQAFYYHAPLIGNLGDVKSFGAIIAFGFLLIMPTMLDQLRDILKSQPSKYSAELGRGFGRGVSAAGVPLGFAWGRFTRPVNKQTGENAGILRRWAAGNPASYDEKLENGDVKKHRRSLGGENRYKIVKALLGGLGDRPDGKH